MSILPMRIPAQHCRRAVSMVSPERIRDTPHSSLAQKCTPGYRSPHGVVTGPSRNGSLARAASTTRRMSRSAKKTNSSLLVSTFLIFVIMARVWTVLGMMCRPRKMRPMSFCDSFRRMCCVIKSTATALSDRQGTMMSALRLLGSTYLSKDGFTKRVYCSMTPPTSRPRSTVSRLMRRARRVSSSVSTNTFMLQRERISGQWSARMPSTMTTSAGLTRLFLVRQRLLVTKSYTGTSTGSEARSVSRQAARARMSKASGASKFTSEGFSHSSLVRSR
mmetsp:Transcript_11334/g.33614  ORF Transcript_11334/g.33614 Transcript_11334/m.33614 type:complete len:276 (+) Transcript_11334:72-899(+)